VDPALSVSDLGGHEFVEASLDRSAALAVPDTGEVDDLLERAAELLGAGDERQPGDRVVVVETVAGLGSAGRLNEADSLARDERVRTW
jgi:hypothetical protein